MKYELHDKVRIKAYWRRVYEIPSNVGEVLKAQQDEIAGEGIKYRKYKKVACDEIGYICGRRSQKISTTLSWEFEDAINVGVGVIPEFEGVKQMASEHIDVYLVATRMNSLRRVSFADIEYIKEGKG